MIKEHTFTEPEELLTFFNDENVEFISSFIKTLEDGIVNKRKEINAFDIRRNESTIKFSFILLKELWLPTLIKLNTFCRDMEMYEEMRIIDKLSKTLKKEKDENVLSSKNSGRNRGPRKR